MDKRPKPEEFVAKLPNRLAERGRLVRACARFLVNDPTVTCDTAGVNWARVKKNRPLGPVWLGLKRGENA